MTKIRVPIRANVSGLCTQDAETLTFLTRAVLRVDAIYQLQKRDGFYPDDLTKEELDEYIRLHPKQEGEIGDHFTIVKRGGLGLEALPYSEAFRSELIGMAELLKSAADRTEHEQLRKFLRSRAKAFESNSYSESDVDWLGVVDAPIELTIGPYEEYEDKLKALKRSFEGILGIVLQDKTAQLDRYQELTKEFDRYLACKLGYTPSGSSTPMVVIDEVVAGGFSRLGFVPMAYNLPNDEDFRVKFGTKKVFISNIIAAKFQNIFCPIANRVVNPKILGALDLNSEIYSLKIVGHELAHGLGFHFNGAKFQVLGPNLEEAKADVFGILFLFFLADKGLLDYENAMSASRMLVIDGLRQLRFGLDEAHAIGALIQHNWHRISGAVKYEDGTITFDEDRMRKSFEDIGNSFAELAISGDYSNAVTFADRWGKPFDEIRSVIERLGDIPVDIEPEFDY